MLPPVFVINLPGEAARRDSMRTRLEQVGLNYSFFPAIDGRGFDMKAALSYDRRKRRCAFGRDMIPGELGCVLSHRGVYEKMVAENIPLALVVEDDVSFAEDFKEVLTALTASPVRYDLIRFLGSEKIYRRGYRKVAKLTEKYWLARLPTAPGGAYGYLLTLEAARTLLRHMQQNWMPIDTLHGRSWATGLETLIVYPAAVFADDQGASTIGDARFDKTITLTGWDRKLFFLTRGWFKLNETLGKKWVYASSWLRDKKSSKQARF